MAKTPAAVRRSKSPAAKLATKAKVWRAFQRGTRLARVDPDRLHERRKRRFTISAARNAKLNSPRVVTPVNPEEERPRPQISSSAHVSSVVLESVTCPIMQALVVRPAVAEDGKIYEYGTYSTRAGGGPVQRFETLILVRLTLYV